MVHERTTPSERTLQARLLPRLTHQVVSRRRKAIGNEYSRRPVARHVPEMARERDSLRTGQVCRGPTRRRLIRLLSKRLPEGPRAHESRQTHRTKILEGWRKQGMRREPHTELGSSFIPNNEYALGHRTRITIGEGRNRTIPALLPG